MTRYAVLLTIEALDDRDADRIVWDLREAFRDRGGQSAGYEDRAALPDMDEWATVTFDKVRTIVEERP